MDHSDCLLQIETNPSCLTLSFQILSLLNTLSIQNISFNMECALLWHLLVSSIWLHSDSCAFLNNTL